MIGSVRHCEHQPTACQSLNEAVSQSRSSELGCLALEGWCSSLTTEYKEANTMLVIVLSILHTEDNEEGKTMGRRTEDSPTFSCIKSVVSVHSRFQNDTALYETLRPCRPWTHNRESETSATRSTLSSADRTSRTSRISSTTLQDLRSSSPVSS
jgi:hypothetical protein